MPYCKKSGYCAVISLRVQPSAIKHFSFSTLSSHHLAMEATFNQFSHIFHRFYSIYEFFIHNISFRTSFTLLWRGFPKTLIYRNWELFAHVFLSSLVKEEKVTPNTLYSHVSYAGSGVDCGGWKKMIARAFANAYASTQRLTEVRHAWICMICAMFSLC